VISDQCKRKKGIGIWDSGFRKKKAASHPFDRLRMAKPQATRQK
jgi:hypothetical protein